MSSRRYCIITPCRDEARFARRTLDSVVHQSLPPDRWVIVDDGSKDETPRILEEYARRYPFIRVVRGTDRGRRAVGGGVIDAFYAGYGTIQPDDYDYLCKLDLDLVLPPRYFEELIERMEAAPRIGTCSGKPYFFPPGAPDDRVAFPLSEGSGVVSERIGDENAIGASKLYRVQCFLQIGGFVRQVMWDGIDGHRCRQLGWIATSWDDPPLRLVHLRPMGSSQVSWWSGRVRHGFGQWFMGTTPIYMLAAALFRMTRPPRLVGGLAMLYGYFRSMVRGDPQYGDAEFRRFLRRYQWACLLQGKARATAELNARQASAWDPARPSGPLEAQAPRASPESRQAGAGPATGAAEADSGASPDSRPR